MKYKINKTLTEAVMGTTLIFTGTFERKIQTAENFNISNTMSAQSKNKQKLVPILYNILV